jgi:AcrR family transcriptional regulator
LSPPAATAVRRRRPTGAAPRAAGPGTRDRILATATDLFNRKGIAHVSIDEVAQVTGMSNGNLNYHFPRKQDLVRAMLERLDARMREALTPRLAARDPREGAEDLVRILRAFWEFRFFFNALTFLLSRDPVLRERYFAFQAWAIARVDVGLKQMVRTGEFGPVRKPNTTRLLAENMWSQWLNWLRMQQIESPDAEVPEGKALYECALRHWSLMEPYFPPAFARGLLPIYRELLL